MGLLMFEHQPRFPEEDIPDTSAEILEMMLQNRELILGVHENAEEALLLYRLGHEALDKAAALHLDDARRLGAFSAGVASFEAISTLVKPAQNPDDRNLAEVSFSIVHSTQGLDRRFALTLGDMGDKLRAELPRTHRIIGIAATRYHQGYEHYAQGGAAMAREVELLATQD